MDANRGYFGTLIGIAAIVLAIAFAYRIVMTKDGKLSFSATAEGVTVTLDELKKAHDALQQTRDQIADKERQLRDAEAALQTREQRVEQLLARAKSQPATSPTAVAMANELKRIQTETPLAQAPMKRVDPRLLDEATQHLQAARQQISKLR